MEYYGERKGASKFNIFLSIHCEVINNKIICGM